MISSPLDILSHNLPSEVHHLDLSPWTQSEAQVYIKRDDLIHPLISGNKWRKLKYNLASFSKNSSPIIVSFGGAFSNHIHALAAACSCLHIPCVGFIRGEIDIENPTLSFCHSKGMELIPLSRTEYRLKENSPTVQEYLKNLDTPIIIPEGGTNALALQGVSEIIDEIVKNQSQYDIIVLAAGTGGTSAGLLSHTRLHSDVWAISALKSHHLYNEILALAQNKNQHRLSVFTDYHRGGYAKYDTELLEFIQDFEQKTQIPLDHVYNGKAMMGLINILNKENFPKNKKILYLHTGGIQGKAGLHYNK